MMCSNDKSRVDHNTIPEENVLNKGRGIKVSGLTNPHPWRERWRAGFSNTDEPPLPQKRAPFPKNVEQLLHIHDNFF